MQREDIKTKMVNTNKERRKLGLTLCWGCDKAGKSQCEWFKFDKPVPGWEADLVPYVATYSNGKFYKQVKTKTYVVRSCPKFKKIQRGEDNADIDT